jgi:MerR family transcriptional regulator, light-induced transcriptional regulator
MPADGAQVAAWVRLLVAPEGRTSVGPALLADRDRLGSWLAVAELLGAVTSELGRLWEQDVLSILDEHIASARLGRALARAADVLPSRDGTPLLLLATPEDERHTLGLALAELVAREHGWTTLWAGDSTPTSDLVRGVSEGTVGAVAMSASVCSERRALERVAVQVSEACARAAVPLVVGGEGPWPEQLVAGSVLRTFPGFRAWMAEVERRR